MLVSKWLTMNKWTSLNMESANMVGISLETEEQIVQIFNIYNDCEHSIAIRALDFFLCSHGRHVK